MSITALSEYGDIRAAKGHIDASAEMALSEAARYEQAMALDQLRAFVFDPNWNPQRDEELLGQLLQATVVMPTTVLGNDVAWVQRSFINYHNAYKQFHNWRLQLKEDIETIELEMLNRQDDTEQSPLWWIGLVGETLLGFFDVFDAIFTIRDGVVHGD